MKEKRKPVPRVGRLDSIGCVASELGKLYRASRHGDLDTLDATRLATVLREIRATIESDDIEKRLTVLENKNEF